MKFEKGNKIGNRYSSTNQPKKNGRRPSLYKQIKVLTGKTVGYEMEQEDYFKVIRFLLEQDSETLEALLVSSDNNGKKILNPKTPTWVLTIVSAIRSDAKLGRTNTVEMLFDRVFGKAVQTIQGNITNTNMPAADEMTDEEIDAELERIEAQLKA